MTLPLEKSLSIGIQSIVRLPDTPGGPSSSSVAALRSTVEMVDGLGYDSMWAGDHISFPLPILDPLLQIAQAAMVSPRLKFGTCVYLLPLRHPAPVAKQVSSLDQLTDGRFIFGVGVGGEFPKEYEACGIPVKERGARLSESIEILRKFWGGEPVSHEGRFFRFSDVPMQPPARQAGGPPVWCGGRSEGALARTGRLADGWISYVVTPQMYRDALAKIAQAAETAGRRPERFGTAHLLFSWVDDTYEKAFSVANAVLSKRYAMDFTKPTQRYAAVGTPDQVAASIREFHDAGVRHVVLDLVGPAEQRDAQLRRFAEEVLPQLEDMRGN